MKATVAYEAPHRRSSAKAKAKAGVKPLKWHRGLKDRWASRFYAKGTKGVYYIEQQKPDRRAGVFKWGLWLVIDEKKNMPERTMLNGKPMSDDSLAELKEAAAVYDALPQGVPVAIVASEAKASEACSACGRAAESPTREEWEVIVTDSPPAHRGAILAAGLPGHGFPVGDHKIVLDGFHDDTQASNVAGAIARQYRVKVTFGPKNALYHAAEPSRAAEEAPRGLLPAQYDFDEHVATELELFADNSSELYPQKEAVIANLKKKMAKGTYNPELAQKLWMYWVDAAAKLYTKQFPGNKWYVAFPPEVRREVARREEERERAEMQLIAKEGSSNPLA